jgi:peptidoglycan/LPS O-acetylase OafA/YrhL
VGGCDLSKEFSLLLKAVACIVIALHHYSQHVVSLGISGNIIYKLLSSQGGFSGVALFFFLSGYGLMESNRNSHNTTLLGRLWRVYRPMLVINLIQYLVMLIASYKFCTNFEIRVIDVFRFYVLDNVFWFVGIIMMCYVTFFLCGLNRNKKRRNLLMMLGMVFSIAIPKLLNEPFNHIMSIPFFFIGVWVSEYKELAASFLRNKCVLLLLTTLIFCLVIGVYVMHSGALFHLSVNIIQTIALLILVSWFNIQVEFSSLLGKLSYPIYLVHNKIIKVSVFFNYWPSVFLFLTVTIVLAFVYDKFLKYQTRLRWDKFKILREK